MMVYWTTAERVPATSSSACIQVGEKRTAGCMDIYREKGNLIVE